MHSYFSCDLNFVRIELLKLTNLLSSSLRWNTDKLMTVFFLCMDPCVLSIFVLKEMNFVFQLGLHQSATDSFQNTVRLIPNDELAYLNAWSKCDHERPEGKQNFREKPVYESVIYNMSAFECFTQYEFNSSRHDGKVELSLEFHSQNRSGKYKSIVAGSLVFSICIYTRQARDKVTS